MTKATERLNLPQMADLRAEFAQYLYEKYPHFKKHSYEGFLGLFAEHLLCEKIISLPQKTSERIQNIIDDFSMLRQKMSVAESLLSQLTEKNIVNPGHDSIMMSYDFHLDEKNEPRLIEINTNAAFHILNNEVLNFRGILDWNKRFSSTVFKKNIIDMVSDPNKKNLRTAIVDENPEQQRLFIEFLVAQQWLQTEGWQCQILDLKQTQSAGQLDFIYNRSTDFYLNSVEGSDLRERIKNGKSIVAPNPYEYYLMADKNRFIEWTKPGVLEALGLPPAQIQSILETLPQSFDLSTKTSEELWNMRKSLFFKPKQEFGSKRAFKGGSISRKLFDSLQNQDLLAQEYIPAPEIEVETPMGPQLFKYDLRCYTYKNKLEGIVARVYQGQVTNLKTPFGGFASVRCLDF